jgi:hypothetical protein
VSGTPSRGRLTAALWLAGGLAAVGLLLAGWAAAVLVRDYPRAAAFDHLRRDERTQALLDTWLVPPEEVLQAFPETQTVIGVRQAGGWLQEVVGVRIPAARLAGPGADDTDLAALRRFPEIEYLELVNTSVSEAAVEEFKRAVPGCKLVRR